MGCWDIFCFICGNPCHGMFQDSVDEFLEIIQYYEKNKHKSSVTNRLKKIYTIAEKDPKITDRIKKLIVSTKWMDKCTFLTIDNRIVHGCKEISCNIHFVDSKGDSYTHDPNQLVRDSTESSYGIFLHTDCWKFIENEYGHKLKYSDLAIIKTKNYNKIFDFINYGSIEKYWSQTFDFIQALVDKKEYICSSPLDEDKNLNQIIKNFKSLKIRTNGEKKGPNVSASFFENDCVKFGQNGKLWIVKNGKWIEIKENIIQLTVPVSKIKSKTLISLKFIGEHSHTPVFIGSIDSTTKNGKIKLIFIESYQQILNDKLLNNK